MVWQGAWRPPCYGFPAGETDTALGLIAGGGALGLGIGQSVSPMAMPQTNAAFHAPVGVAVGTCLASYAIHPTAGVGHKLGAMMGNYIGGVTLAGSAVAFGTLNRNLNSKPMNLHGKNMLKLGGAGRQEAMLGLFCTDVSLGVGTGLMYATTLLSSAMGWDCTWLEVLVELTCHVASRCLILTLGGPVLLRVSCWGVKLYCGWGGCK